MRNIAVVATHSAPLDITNDFGVGVQGSLVVFTRPPGRGITKPAARRLAAHLMALADDSTNHWLIGDLLAAIEEG